MKKFALVGALATLTLAATACGGGGSDALSEREYIRELEGLCRQVTDDLEELEAPEDYADLVNFAEDAKDITSDGLAELQELQPPEELEGDHEDYVASIENTIDLTDDLIAAAEDEDDDAIGEVQEDLAKENDERNSIAEDIGADDCVDDAGTGPVDDPDVTTIPDETIPDETTVPDDPDTTTIPDEPTDTTEPDETLPPITVPPVEMTIPDETEPPVMAGSDIGTFDFDNLTTPAGYVWENIDSASLANIQDTFATAYEGQIALIGGAIVADQATGEELRAFVFFWNEDIVASGTGIEFLDGFTSSAVESADSVTEAGFPVTRWIDDDGAEGLGAIDADVSVILYGGPGSTDALFTFFDAFITSQG